MTVMICSIMTGGVTGAFKVPMTLQAIPIYDAQNLNFGYKICDS